MRTLKFKCTGQKLVAAGDFSRIVPGSKGYLRVSIDFDKEWDGFVKAAEFATKAGTFPVLVEKGGICDVPDEVTDARSYTIRIVGKKGAQKIITNKSIIRQEG